MPLVPCDSCRRHVRVADPECPFCKTTRSPSAIVAVVLVGAIMIAGCDVFSSGDKYGGPPARYVERDAAPEPAPSTSTSSPRIDNKP